MFQRVPYINLLTRHLSLGGGAPWPTGSKPLLAGQAIIKAGRHDCKLLPAIRWVGFGKKRFRVRLRISPSMSYSPLGPAKDGKLQIAQWNKGPGLSFPHPRISSLRLAWRGDADDNGAPLGADGVGRVQIGILRESWLKRVIDPESLRTYSAGQWAVLEGEYEAWSPIVFITDPYFGGTAPAPHDIDFLFGIELLT